MWGGHSADAHPAHTPPTPLRPRPSALLARPSTPAASATATWISPWLPGLGCSSSWALVLRAGPARMAWLGAGVPGHSLLRAPLAPHPSLSDLPQMESNWILGDVNRGVAGEECAEGTTGVMRVTLCVCTVGMWGLGCRGASRVPAAAPSPQPAQRHTGFSQLSSRCQFDLVTPGQGVPWPPTATRLC